jgi:folate-binding protein YgfZ
MEKDQIIILEDRGLISVSGEDAKDFLQNIITNNIEKVNQTSSIFSALFSPQGKYLHEFFLIKSNDGFFVDCDGQSAKDLVNQLSKYKLRSRVEIKDFSSEYAVGIISLDKFQEIQSNTSESTETILYRDCPVFIDPRSNKLGARILSTLEKLHLTIKSLNLKIIGKKIYINKAHLNGVPIERINYLKDQLFGLEANFEELKAIDFKKGCYVGQENTARMKLKNKLRRRLLAIKTDHSIEIGSELLFNKTKIGKILIGGSYPFALIKLFDPDFSEFKDKEITINGKKVKIINSYT